jgi:hypothetical protein
MQHSHNLTTADILKKCDRVQTYGEASKKSNLHSQRKELIKFGECLIAFSSEIFVFPSPV